MQTCCFTGHRDLSAGAALDALRVRLNKIIVFMLDDGVLNFIAGSAIGFDMLAASAVLEAKKLHSGVKLTVMLPCKNYDIKWSEENKRRQREILTAADKVIFVSEHYTHDCMYKRNRAMVGASEFCVAFLHKSTGGTAYTVYYAH